MKPAILSCALSLAALGVAPSAGAVEVYVSDPYPAPRTVYVPSPLVWSSPSRVVITQPTTYVHLQPRPLVIEQPPAEDPPTHPQPEERRDPSASVFVGAGYGGMTSDRGTAGTWRLHLGLGLGATELGLRADIADRSMARLSNREGSAYRVGAEVAHRFLEGATVRPVIGASFDRWQFAPDGAASAGAFGVGARGGVEVHYHLHPGAALVFGADLGYHRILAAIDGADVARDVLTFGATMDIRL
jgi:hypothetical protein